MPRTVAPERLASWTAIVPTPPAAADTATTSPAVRCTDRTAAYAVEPATNRPPATCHGTAGGLGGAPPAGAAPATPPPGPPPREAAAPAPPPPPRPPPP